MERIEVELDHTQVSENRSLPIAHVKITKDGKVARCWLDVKIDDYGHVVAILTTRKANGQDTAVSSVAKWRKEQM